MADEIFYSKKRNVQWRGPTTSDDYNSRIEENYRDLTVIGNKLQTCIETLEYIQRYMVKNTALTTNAILTKIKSLETLGENENAYFNNINIQVDNDRFNATPYNINQSDRLNFDKKYNVFTLPKVDSGSFSKLKYVSMDGEEVLSPNFKVFVEPIGAVEQRPENIIDANDFYNCVLSDTTLRGWELSSIVDKSFNDESRIRIYVTLPDDLALVRDSNTILFNPLINSWSNLSNVQYTTNRNITFGSSDGWKDFEVGKYPISVDNRWVLPDSGEEIEEIVGTMFSFPPLPITGIRFELSVDQPLEDNAYNVYTQGIQKFDIRYDKFNSEGKTILKIEDDGLSINEIESVTPILANCTSSEVPFVFDYRPIWETSLNSGVYTLDPVPSSTRLWIEITLRKTISGGAPIMPFLLVENS